jgi:hypothetical protein
MQHSTFYRTGGAPLIFRSRMLTAFAEDREASSLNSRLVGARSRLATTSPPRCLTSRSPANLAAADAIKYAIKPGINRQAIVLLLNAIFALADAKVSVIPWCNLGALSTDEHIAQRGGVAPSKRGLPRVKLKSIQLAKATLVPAKTNTWRG